jgi:crotonobetaine/carnitine-CoA ligase
MPLNIVGRRNLRLALESKVQLHPQKPFLFFENEEGQVDNYTYEQFDRMVNRTANGLLELGVKKKDKVNLHLTSCAEFLFFWFACAKVGAVMVPTNPLSPAAELKYPLAHSESTITVTQPHLLAAVNEARQGSHVGEVILVHAQEADGVIPYSQLVGGQSDELAPVELDPLDDASILYTSGTTSLPKGVRITHANYIYVGETTSKLIGLRSEDRHMVVMPLFHANAQYFSFMSTLNVGASAALMSRFSASRYMKQVINHSCTVGILVAASMRMILAQPRDGGARENRLRLVLFAQNVTPQQLQEWEERFEAPLLQIYGMTETVGLPMANPLDYPRDNMTIGMATLAYDCRVVDQEGNDVLRGTPGELLVPGKPGWTITKGYFKNPEATAIAIRDGYLWTGDIVAEDENGYVRFVDRANDIIKRAGENIAAGEVEAVIKQHPKVSDAAVIGIPDPVRDESIKAFVILKEHQTATSGEIIQFCQARLSKFRVPEAVEFRGEFPRNSVGKIQKRVLRGESEVGH